jgi:hypothetical protein
VGSLHKYVALRPQQVVLTHYGPVPDAAAALAESEETLHRWVELAAQVTRESPDAGVEEIAAAFSAAFVPPADQLDEKVRARLELLNGVHSNAAGISRYLARRRARAEGAVPPR